MYLRNIYDSRRIWKMVLLAVSLVLVAVFIYFSNTLVKDLNKFAAVCRVVNTLRHCRIGQIGTRPLGFNTCRASEKHHTRQPQYPGVAR